jgi:ABC-type antimicrobial peptide transport system permease subunit
VALVNQAFVDRYMPNVDPVEKEIDLGIPGKLLGTAPAPDDQMPLKVVGVIGNVRNLGMARPPAPEIISFFYQYSSRGYNGNFKFILARTNVEPTALIPALRNTLNQIDPDVPLALTRTVEDMMSLQAGDSRFNALLFGVFAGIGVLLAIVGVYGVTSYLVAQRTQEIAVRIALGAQQGSISWLLIKQGIFIGTIGAILGMTGAFILRQGVAKLVYGISPLDPATFIGAAVLLVCCCILAVVVPIKRALRLSPVVALHEG